METCKQTKIIPVLKLKWNNLKIEGKKYIIIANNTLIRDSRSHSSFAWCIAQVSCALGSKNYCMEPLLFLFHPDLQIEIRDYSSAVLPYALKNPHIFSSVLLYASDNSYFHFISEQKFCLSG